MTKIEESFIIVDSKDSIIFDYCEQYEHQARQGKPVFYYLVLLKFFFVLVLWSCSSCILVNLFRHWYACLDILVSVHIPSLAA